MNVPPYRALHAKLSHLFRSAQTNRGECYMVRAAVCLPRTTAPRLRDMTYDGRAGLIDQGGRACTLKGRACGARWATLPLIPSRRPFHEMGTRAVQSPSGKVRLGLTVRSNEAPLSPMHPPHPLHTLREENLE